MAREVLRVEGADVLARRLRALPGALEAAARRAVTAEVDEIADDMRRGAPRDTGELVDSVQAEVAPDGMSGVAAATAMHAEPVEFGTEDTRAQPFAGPAAEAARRRFPDRVAREINAELHRLGQR